MLHEETVERKTLDLIRSLMADEQLSVFNLVGGTALALQAGHRISVDIDLFTTSDFDARQLAEYLISSYHATEVNIINNGIFCFIDAVKTDVLAHKYPLLENTTVIDGVRSASLKDIGAMKLHAIYNNGTRLKDFVDMYVLLERFPLQELLDACKEKYPENNHPMVKMALTHFDDIDFGFPVKYVSTPIKWEKIADRLLTASKNPHLTFQNSVRQEQKTAENRPRLRRIKGRRL